MKKVLILCLLSNCFLMLHAQTTSEEQSAARIAQLFKDSLSLNDAEKQQIYLAILPLHQQKQHIRQQYSGSDSLTFLIRQIEATREQVYRSILPSAKYQLYLQKKRWLTSSN